MLCPVASSGTFLAMSLGPRNYEYSFSSINIVAFQTPTSWSWARRIRSIPRNPRPLPCAGRLCMQDFSSSAYWNNLYLRGGDGSGDIAQQITAEWHLDGDALISPLERLLGSPAETPSEDVAILNVGCGTSTLWARSVPTVLLFLL